jgi:hypothetical protein
MVKLNPTRFVISSSQINLYLYKQLAEAKREFGATLNCSHPQTSLYDLCVLAHFVNAHATALIFSSEYLI